MTSKNDGEQLEATGSRNRRSRAILGRHRRSATWLRPRSQGGDTGSNPVGTTTPNVQVSAQVRADPPPGPGATILLVREARSRLPTFHRPAPGNFLSRRWFNPGRRVLPAASPGHHFLRLGERLPTMTRPAATSDRMSAPLLRTHRVRMIQISSRSSLVERLATSSPSLVLAMRTYPEQSPVDLVPCAATSERRSSPSPGT